MDLNKMSFEKQVRYLRSIFRSGKNSFTSYLALFAFRHHVISKHSPAYSQKPVLRWYLGQLAKEYITKFYNEVKGVLLNFTDIRLLEIKSEGNSAQKEYHLNESLYPALRQVLEEIFGKDYVSNVILRAKFYRNPKSNKGHGRNPGGWKDERKG
jgi:hypothetical protein